MSGARRETLTRKLDALAGAAIRASKAETDLDRDAAGARLATYHDEILALFEELASPAPEPTSSASHGTEGQT